MTRDLLMHRRKKRSLALDMLEGRLSPSGISGPGAAEYAPAASADDPPQDAPPPPTNPTATSA